MGGINARIAVLAAVCAALVLGAPAPAFADGPLDGVPAVPAAADAAGAVAGTAPQEAVSLVGRTTDGSAPAIAETADRLSHGAAPAAPAATPSNSVRRGAGRAAARGPAASARSEPGTRWPRSDPERAAQNSSPRHGRTASPRHGRTATPPARSQSERAGAARSGAPSAAQRPSQREQQDLPGLAGAAGAASPPMGALFVALMLVAFSASLPSVLRSLDLPAPVFRRPAFASPVEPPG